MANYSNLANTIRNSIKTNGNNEITGAILQQVLLSMVTNLGAQFQFCGIATQSTSPGTPDYNVAYIAGPGTYQNFNNLTIPSGRIGVFLYNGSWAVQTIEVGGGGGGSSVSWNQLQTIGVKIAEITIGGITTDVYAPSGGGGAFVPEETDLQLVSQVGGDPKLKFADRINGTNISSGKNYVIVREGENLATKLSSQNTIYEIRYDFDLSNGSITIPQNCTLKFNGGRISNGSIVFQNTSIDSPTGQIFNNIAFSGTLIGIWNVTWCGINPSGNSTPIFQSAINLVAGSQCKLYVPNGTYLLAPQIVNAYSSTKYCHLFVPDSLQIVGESREHCILKRVKSNLSAPQESEYQNHASLWGSLIVYKMATNDNGKISIKDITLDGNQNWEHLEFEDSVDGEKIFESTGANHVIDFDISNVNALNQANEAFYSDNYTKLGTRIRFRNCNFKNIGGGATNIGGDDFEAVNCFYDGCCAEHSWSGEERNGRAIFSNCTFINRYNTFLSSDYQGANTDAMKIGKYLFVENCKFIITDDFYTSHMAGTTRINTGIYFGSIECAYIYNNTFIGFQSTDEQGGSCVSLRMGGYKPLYSYIENNILYSKRGKGKFVNESSETTVIKNNVFHIIDSPLNKIGDFQDARIWQNNEYCYDFSMQSSGVKTIQFWMRANKRMVVKVHIEDKTGSQQNVTVDILDRNSSVIATKTLAVSGSSSENILFVFSLTEVANFVAGNTVIRSIRVTSAGALSVNISATESNDIPADSILDSECVGVVGWDSANTKPKFWTGWNWVDADGTIV